MEFSKHRISLSAILYNEQERQYTDKRVNHLKRVFGNRTPDSEEKLLKGLSQISLARQFSEWESERGWKCRVDDLYHKICLMRQRSCLKSTGNNWNGNEGPGNKCTGKISRYIRDRSYPRSDQSVVNSGIKKGTIQLAFRMLLNDSLSDFGEHAVEGMFAMVTIFEFTEFQSLKIEDMPQLIDLLVKEAAASTESHADASILRSMEAISPWFKRMGSDFELVHRSKHIYREFLNAG